jgi:hypothetical protein
MDSFIRTYPNRTIILEDVEPSDTLDNAMAKMIGMKDSLPWGTYRLVFKGRDVYRSGYACDIKLSDLNIENVRIISIESIFSVRIDLARGIGEYGSVRDAGFIRRVVPRWREREAELFGCRTDGLELQESTLSMIGCMGPRLPYPPGCHWAVGSKYNGRP